jgi:hypothetical protein
MVAADAPRRTLVTHAAASMKDGHLSKFWRSAASPASALRQFCCTRPERTSAE